MNEGTALSRNEQDYILANYLAYWKQQLDSMPQGLALVTDHRSRPARPSSQRAIYYALLPQGLTESIKKLSVCEGVSLYMVLVAAFLTLLHRYTMQVDGVSGTVSGDHTTVESDALNGVPPNTRMLLNDLSDNPTFRELLTRMRRVIVDAMTHQVTPFEILSKTLRPERHGKQKLLFQVILTFDRPQQIAPEEWALTQIEAESEVPSLDLKLALDDASEGLKAYFEYRTDLFDEATITRMAGHWQTLLGGIVVNPDHRLSQIPMLTEKERHQLLVEWNATKTEYQKDVCIHQLFEEQVTRTPEAVAIVFDDQQITYRELNERANQLSHRLQKLGVGTEVLVGLYIDRSFEMIIGLLGILKAGGAYVPLDPAFPSERIAFMLEDSQAQVIVTMHQLASMLPTIRTTIVCLDTDELIWEQQPVNNTVTVATADKLAYVIYTSGSTGRPKGVQILHRSLVNFLMAMQQKLGLTVDDRWLAITTLSFDIAALELFLPLIVGACVVIASRDAVTNGMALTELLSSSHITMMQATPVTWRMLLVAGWKGNADLKILCGGEALPLELARQLLPKVTALWNLYGPTETTIWSTLCQIEPEDTVITIGRPIANTELYILSPELQLLPVGGVGELYIGGEGLARGYRNRPELTAERFIRHPFSADPGTRLYRTGDLARYRADGTIEHLGRLDFQVKIRGFRIELGEIESILNQHPAIQQAVVMAREEVLDDKRLVAYVVLDKNQTASVGELRQYAMKQLPNYMVPSAFVFLETMPLTPNCKIDRRSLPVPYSKKDSGEESYVAPTHVMHHQLIPIWEELLSVQPIGIRDNFFYLGGHSLLVMQLIEHIEQIFHQKVHQSTIFANPTIEQLTAVLQGQVETDSQLPIEAIQIRSGRANHPFFFLHGNWRGDGFYCYPLAQVLGAEQPFYAFPPYPLDGLQHPPTLEAMATQYIEALRLVQPEGPYILGGWCNGALVAYEMARQLHMQEQKVNMLILVHPIDFFLPAHIRWVHNVICLLGNLLHLNSEKQLDCFLWLCHISNYLHHTSYVQTEEFHRMKAINQAKWTSRRKIKGWLHFHLAMLFPAIELLRTYEPIFLWLAASYAAPSSAYTGKTALLLLSDEAYPKTMWKRLVEWANTKIYVLPGTHEDLLTEHLFELAKQLQTCIEDIQKDVYGSHHDFSGK